MNEEEAVGVELQQPTSATPSRAPARGAGGRRRGSTSNNAGLRGGVDEMDVEEEEEDEDDEEDDRD